MEACTAVLGVLEGCKVAARFSGIAKAHTGIVHNMAWRRANLIQVAFIAACSTLPDSPRAHVIGVGF